MSNSMDELVARVASAAAIPADQATRAINLIFAFLKHEAPLQFTNLEASLPEATTAAAAGDADRPTRGGMVGGLMSMIGGGGIIGLAGRLTSLGLGTGEMTAVGRELFAFAREKVGDDRVDEIAEAIPGLSQFV